jgi:hypothetical protein
LNLVGRGDVENGADEGNVETEDQLKVAAGVRGILAPGATSRRPNLPPKKKN